MGERATLPHWPRRMTAAFAAAYLGVSPSKFHRGVNSGVYPPGKSDGGNMLWDIKALDAWSDRWAGLQGEDIAPPIP